MAAYVGLYHRPLALNINISVDLKKNHGWSIVLLSIELAFWSGSRFFQKKCLERFHNVQMNAYSLINVRNEVAYSVHVQNRNVVLRTSVRRWTMDRRVGISRGGLWCMKFHFQNKQKYGSNNYTVVTKYPSGFRTFEQNCSYYWLRFFVSVSVCDVLGPILIIQREGQPWRVDLIYCNFVHWSDEGTGFWLCTIEIGMSPFGNNKR